MRTTGGHRGKFNHKRKAVEKGPQMGIKEARVKSKKAGMAGAWREPNCVEAVSLLDGNWILF